MSIGADAAASSGAPVYCGAGVPPPSAVSAPVALTMVPGDALDEREHAGA